MSDLSTCPRCGMQIARIDDFVRCTLASPCPVAYAHAHAIARGLRAKFADEAAYLGSLMSTMFGYTEIITESAPSDPPPPAVAIQPEVAPAVPSVDMAVVFSSESAAPAPTHPEADASQSSVTSAAADQFDHADAGDAR